VTLLAAFRTFAADLGSPAPEVDRIPGAMAFLSAALNLLSAVAGVALTGLAAGGAGGPVVAAAVGSRRHRGIDGLVLDGIAGLAIMGLALLGLGLAGLIRAPVVLGLTGAAAAGALSRRIRARPLDVRLDTLHLLVAALAGAALLGGVFGALAPEIEVDSLSYHLGKVVSFAGSGRVAFGAFRPSLFVPSMWELVLTPAFLLCGESGVRLVNPALVVATAILLWRSFAGNGPTGGVLAASLFASATAVIGLASSVKNDLLVVCLTFGAFRIALDARRDGAVRPAWLCGLLLGAAAGVKVTAFPAIAVTVGFVAWPGGGRSSHARVRLLACGAVLIAAFLPWVLLAFAWTGNPAFPFAASWFGGGVSEGTWELTRREWYGYVRGDYGGVQGAARALWTVATVDGGLILPLMAVPALAALGRGGWAGTPWGACAVAECVLWLGGPPRARYLLPAVPVCCGAVGWLVAAVPRAEWRRVAAAFCACVIALEVGRGWLGRECDRIARIAAATGVRDPEGYRLARLGGYAHVARWIGDHLPAGAGVLVFGDVRAFLTGRRAIVHSTPDGPLFLEAAEEARDQAHLGRKLRQASATHLLYNRTSAVFRRESLARIRPSRRALVLWSRWFRAHARLVYEPPFADLRNGSFYVIELGNSPLRASIVLPGCEGWLWEPERLVNEGHSADAQLLFDALRRDTGDCAMVRQAYATIMLPVIGPGRTEAMLIGAEAAGMRSVNLYRMLAEICVWRGSMDLAEQWRARARALEFPAWLAAHPSRRDWYDVPR